MQLIRLFCIFYKTPLIYHPFLGSGALKTNNDSDRITDLLLTLVYSMASPKDWE